jgi:hypothetical protein
MSNFQAGLTAKSGQVILDWMLAIYQGLVKSWVARIEPVRRLADSALKASVFKELGLGV